MLAQSDKKIYLTKKIDDNLSPVIDGEISDEAWNQVEWSSGFIQFQPEENTQPSNQTKYKLLYDNNAVYIFVKSINNPNEIVNRLSRRDKLEGDARPLRALIRAAGDSFGPNFRDQGWRVLSRRFI